MSQLNQMLRTALERPVTHEGAPAARLTPLQELIRLTMACMLWEDGFYESGKTVATRIAELVHKVTLEQASGVAIEAREAMKLRHVPLLIVREMARHPQRNTTSICKNDGLMRGCNSSVWISETLTRVIQRPDELSEFLAIYWKDGKQPLSKQVKLGLAKAFQKFNEYSLAKYNRKKDIMLRDVLFLCHSKPVDADGSWTKKDRAAFKAAKNDGTDIGAAVAKANSLPHDRLILLTDEQSMSSVPNPVVQRAYCINVASNKNGVGYGRWLHIDGFSEAVVSYIQRYEESA